MLIRCPDCPFMEHGRRCAVTGLVGREIRECPHRALEKEMYKTMAAPEGAALVQEDSCTTIQKLRD